MSADALSDDQVRARARSWMAVDPDPATVAELTGLLDADDLAALHDRFDDRLQFGTAGLRGALGAGPNRMNRVLVRVATAGVAAWLKGQGLAGPVVIGRDARHGSADFAHDTAQVFAAAGFPVRMLPEPVPTPVTAFAVRQLGAVAGVMVTASHNPPQDNGYKLYLGDGAQIVSPTDIEISACIDAIDWGSAPALSTEGVEPVGDAVVEAYLAGALDLLDPGPRQIATVYTAMHGVGAATLRRAFAAAGFPAPVEVAAQVEPDPDFPTVAFPNPEEPGALDLALATAREAHADLVIANDPDADRLAIAVPDAQADGGWRALTGDELGAILADHLLRQRPRTTTDLVATTVVSSRLLETLAAEAGASYGEALTGFKWVVRTPGPGQRFVFGYEEALGYCVGELVRDKDGITAALAVAELAATLKADGHTLLSRLGEIFTTHGAHVTRQRSIRVAGRDWLDRVTAAMAAVRAEPPTEIAGRAVTAVEDLDHTGTRFPVASDVLIWTLDGARTVVRPSGTEPKLKAYAEAVEAVGPDGDVDAARQRALATVNEVLDAVAALLGTKGI